MEELKRLRQLHQLAQMHADRATAELARAMAPENAINEALARLEQKESFEPQNPEEARAAVHAHAWRKSKRRELTTALAERRAITQPIKEDAARKIARASVLERLIQDKT